MDNDVIELLDILYGMISEAYRVPLGNDRCIIEREKAIEIINEIKANLPSSLAESKRLVAARDEFIGNAKKEAEALRKSAEEKAKKLVEEARKAVEDENYELAVKKYDEAIALCPRYGSIRRERQKSGNDFFR